MLNNCLLIRYIVVENSRNLKFCFENGTYFAFEGDELRLVNNGKRLMYLCLGYGNLSVTAENTPPGFEEPKQIEAAKILVKAASNCLVTGVVCVAFSVVLKSTMSLPTY